MNDLFFWLKWKSSYRILYTALLLLFLASIGAFIFAYMYGDLYTIGWDSTGEWKTISLHLDTFSVNQFEIPQESQQYLLLKRYTSNDISIHPWISYIYLSIILIAFILFLTVISYLELWLYIVGMALFLFFIVSMQTEQLGILGMYNKIPTVAVILIFGGLTYYFNAFKKDTSLFIRLASLSIITGLFIAGVIFTSKINLPLLYVANYSLAIPIIISILFMFIVGYDIIQFLVVVTSYGKSDFKTKGNAIWNFILIGSLYIINLYLVYFKPSFVKEMDLVLLQPFAVLCISGILGIWLFEMKQEITSVIPFKPLGAILYLSLGIITFSTIAFGYATANDALVGTLELSALYIQIGMGLGIFLYVITNFWTKYKKNEPVYKQFYITYQVPFYVARGIGWVIVLYFVFSSERHVFHLSKAAYYNNVGDVYLHTGQDDLAESFYLEAFSFAPRYQRTNYSLANFYEQRENKPEAFTYYENCLNRNPTPYAFTSLSNFYINNNQLLPAMLMLKDGLKQFPNDPHLLNNLGYLYTKFDAADSASFYFFQATNNTEDDLPASNLLVYYGAQGKFNECNAIIANKKGIDSKVYEANKIGITTLQGKQADSVLTSGYLTDTLLAADDFTYLYNYTFNKLSKTDTLVDYILQRYSTYECNYFYRPNLLYAKASHLYYSQTNVNAALELMQQITVLDNAPIYIITLATWQLKAGLYEQAHNTFRSLIAYPDQRYIAYKCLAALEYGNTADVATLINDLTKSLTPQIASMAATLKASLATPSLNQYSTLSDKQKVQCLHYHALTTPEFISFKNSIQDPEQSILLDLHHIQLLNEQGQYEASMQIWNALNKSNTISEHIIAQANLEKLKILAGLKQWETLKTELKSTLLLSKDLGYIEYFMAKCLEHGTDSLAAGPLYKQALNKIGYDANVQIDYANYLAKTVGDFEAAESLDAAKRVISYSKPLSLAYIEVCLRLGLFKAAEDELKSIQSKLSDSEILAITSRFYAAPVQ
jgi:hypothetical protein